MNFFEKHWFPNSKSKFVRATRKPFCLIFALLCFFAVLALILGLVLPQLIDCIRLIIDRLPELIGSAIHYLRTYHILDEETLTLLEKMDWKGSMEQIRSLLPDSLTGVVGILFSAVKSVISDFLLGFFGFVFAIYILLSKEKLKEQFQKLSFHYLPQKFYQKGSKFLQILNDSLHRYLLGQGMEAVILGCLCTLGMFLLDLPYPTMIGALIAFTSLIPVAGAYIGGTVGALMILSVSPLKALIFLIFLVVLQQIEGNLIYPKVVGSSLRLPGFWVLLAVIVGGGVAGIWGMLFGVPLVATFYRIISEDMKAKEALSREESAEKTE